MKKEILKIAYKYILLLLIAAVLCTGTVFSRYASSDSNSFTADVGTFNYSYTVSAVSSRAFTNVDYYYTDPNGIQQVSSGATLRYLTFTIDSNYSDVSAQSTFSFSADYEFLSNIAFQIIEVVTDDSGATSETPVTPQYVMSELLNGNGTTSGYTDYDEITNASGDYLNQNLTVSSGTNSFTATDSTGNTTISLTTATGRTDAVTYIYGRGTEYSEIDDLTGELVYFNDYGAPSVYVECEETGRSYSTLEISLSELNIDPSVGTDGDGNEITSGTQTVKTFKFYFTTIYKTDLSSSDYYFNAKSANCTCYYYNVNGVKYYENSADAEATTNSVGTNAVKVQYTSGVASYYYVSGDSETELINISGNVYGDATSGIYINVGEGNFGLYTNYSGTATYRIATTKDDQNNYNEEPTGIIYPMILNIIFAQSEQF